MLFVVLFIYYVSFCFCKKVDTDFCDSGDLNSECIVESPRNFEDHNTCDLSGKCTISGNGTLIFKENGCYTSNTGNITVYITMGKVIFLKNSFINALIIYIKANDSIIFEEKSYLNASNKIHNFNKTINGFSNGGSGGQGYNSSIPSYFYMDTFINPSGYTLIEDIKLGTGSNQSRGGGNIVLISKHLILNGSIYSDGENANMNEESGGGSGGSILIITDDLYVTIGLLSAKGGDGTYDKQRDFFYGGGGGGRIAIYVKNITRNDNYDDNFIIRGGVGVTPCSTGGAGTLYFKGENESLLLTSNKKYETYSVTPINLISDKPSNFTIKDYATVYSSKLDFDKSNGNTSLTIVHSILLIGR